MAIALGCVRMSLDDFDRCTPSEFTSVVEAWAKQKESDIRTSWEQTRFIAFHCIQPYSKKQMKLTDICRFAWDREEKRKAGTTSTRERMEEMMKRLRVSKKD